MECDIVTVLKVLFYLFVSCVLAYMIGRMFGLGFTKSFKGLITPPASSENATAKGVKQHETK